MTSGKVNTSVTSRKVKNGRSTGTCEHRHDDLRPNRFNKQIKIGLKMRVFPQKQKPIGGISPLAQKDLIQLEFCPFDCRKAPEGRLPRLSKAVKVTAANNDYCPSKIHAKRGRAYPTDGALCRVFLAKTFETSSKPPHLEGKPIFNRWDRSSKSSTAVKSYPDCSQNQSMLE